MKKKRYLQMGLAIALGQLTGFSNLAQANIYAGGTVGDNVTIDTNVDVTTVGLVGHAFGIYTNTDNSSVTTTAGNYLTIITRGSESDGIRTNYSNGNPTNLPKSSGNIRIGDHLYVETNALSADALNINGSAKVFIGNDAVIVTKYTGSHLGKEGAHALRLNHNGEIHIADRANISTLGAESHGLYGTGANGIFDIGAKSTVKTEGTKSSAAYFSGAGVSLTVGAGGEWTTAGENANVLQISSKSATLTFGEQTKLKSDGANSHGIHLTGAGTTIDLGAGSSIATTKDNSYAVAIEGYSKATTKNGSTTTTLTGDNTKTTLGDYSKISTEGNVSHGVYMYAQEGLVTLGENSEVITNGNGSHGLYGHGSKAGTDPDFTIYGEKGKIEVGDGLNLKTTGDASHAAYVDWATSSIEFQGGATINATGANSYVMLADAGKITSKLDTNGDVISGGKFLINGDMTAANGGLIDLVLGNGSIFVGSADENTGTIKLKMEAGSKWYVTADKCVDLVMEDGSILYLGTPQDQVDFSLKNVTNTGKMTVNGGTSWFQADVGSVSGDRLVVENAIEGTSGKIAVENLGASVTDGTEKLVLVEAKNSGAGFTLANAVEQGGYIYRLDSESDGATGTNWFLYGTRQGTSTGSASVNVFSGGYLLNYAETQTLLQRMGDLRQDSSDGGVWARAYGGKFTSSADGFLSGFDMTYSGMQVGADKKIALKNKGNIYVGGMFGYSKGNLDYGVGSGSIDSKTLGAYGTYIAPTGFYADLVLKYGWMKNDFKVLDSAGDWVTGDDMSTDGLSASLEVGQRIHFDRQKKEGWYLEPQAQISMGHQSGGSFNASNGLRVDVDSYTSTLGRLGLNAGYEVKSGKNPINVYAKVSYVHEFDGDVGYRLNGSSEQTSFGDSWWTYGVGITAQINKKHNVYLDIERASGGQFNQPWSLNGGYRFNW